MGPSRRGRPTCFSRSSQARTCIAPGSTSRMSRIPTRPTSRISRPTRRSLDETAKEKGYRATLLAFALKAAVVGLKEFPEFNASLRAR